MGSTDGWAGSARHPSRRLRARRWRSCVAVPTSRRASDTRRGSMRHALAALAAISAVCAAGLVGWFAPAQAQGVTDADALYAARASLTSALAAAAEWERRLARDAADFESAWKLARACYWLGSHVPDADRRRRFEQGIAAGQQATATRPREPHGHFWTAANMGAMAEGFGLRAGLKYRGAIKRALETARALDPGFLHGGPDRALGRWYLKVPRLFGGSEDKSVEHLERSLSYGNSIASRFFLAETYLEMKKRENATRELEAVLALPPDPEWVPEEREFKAKAQALLDGLARSR